MDADYLQAAGLYSDIVCLFDKVAEAKAFIRAPRRTHPRIKADPRYVVHADLAFLGLITKAATTHAAVKTLTDAGFGQDATALCRVMVENVILIEWLQQDVGFRLDLYCLSPNLRKRRFASVVNAHYTHRPELVAAAEAFLGSREHRLTTDVFGDSYHAWAKRLDADWGASRPRNLGEMAQDLSDPAPSFLYEGVYFRQSAYVHSTADAVAEYMERLPTTIFTLQAVPSDARRTETLRTANLLMLAALAALARYIGVDLELDLDAVRKAMERAATSG